MSFTSLDLSAPILKAIAEQGYDNPTPIQAQAIPAILAGKDVLATAQTGTGKTAGFALPILELLSKGEPARSNQVRALIVTPTRELAAQVADTIASYGKYLPLRSSVVFGGVKINPQMMRLRKGLDLLVATPGRLLDLYNQNALKFSRLEVLVLDEADRMLDMGFIEDIRKILALLPTQRQNLLFSATFSNDLRNLAKGLVKNPLQISVGPPNTEVKAIEQWICPVDKGRKSALLTHLIQKHHWQQALIFCRTKMGVNRLTRHLESVGINAVAIHGDKTQGARTKALAEFKQGSTRILVATDIAARGLDIDQLPQVVNFDLPKVPADYLHRIGRTGRAGATGQAVSLVSADEIKQLMDIERLLHKLLPRKFVPDFEPIHDLPKSQLDKRPPRPKKPKKLKAVNTQRSATSAKTQTIKPAANERTGAQKRNTRKGRIRAGSKSNRRLRQGES